MLLLILEIGLTISAWQRGWKGWALLPGAIAFLSGFMFGMVFIGDGGTAADLSGVGIIFDILCVIALIIMVCNPRGIHTSSHTTVKPEQNEEINPPVSSVVSQINIK